MAAAASSARCGGTGGRADAAEAYDVRAAFEAELLSPSAPCMNVLLFAVGSRGGVAPFVRIALELVAYGHRVRLATHGAFRGWVESEAEGAFEFFPLAGQPETLMNYMTAQEGRVFPKDWQELQDMLLSLPQNQEIIRQLVTSTLPAATAAASTPQRPSDSESDSDDATLPSSSSSAHEFLAEAIIANPLSFGAIHVAQGLGIPLHMVYPQPWVATKRWPHPLALHPLFDCDYVSCSKNPGWNEASYGVVNKVLWHSQSSAVNDFRSALGLSHITLGQRNDLLRDHQVPFSFLWPRAIIDKPVDWEDHIRVVGSVHPGSGVGRMTPINSGIKDAECQARLESFLAAPATPIFVGFGSCEPKAEELCRLVDMIVAAAEDADVRIVFQFNQLDMWYVRILL